jgi:hypothetical protein
MVDQRTPTITSIDGHECGARFVGELHAGLAESRVDPLPILPEDNDSVDPNRF